MCDTDLLCQKKWRKLTTRRRLSKAHWRNSRKSLRTSLIQDTLMQLMKAWWYTKLDVRNAYNLLCISPCDEWKTAFLTREWLFESLVMQFGLTNDNLATFFNRYDTAYLDGILIYLDILDEYWVCVSSVLETLSGAGLHLKLEKSEFHKEEVRYFWRIIGREWVKKDPNEVEAVQDCPLPQSTFDVWSFIGFPNFYRRFIRNLHGIVRPLKVLNEKNVKFK